MNSFPPQAFDYAQHIIRETKTFMDFAIALVDYMGEDIIPYCKSIYCTLMFSPCEKDLLFQNIEEIDVIDEKSIREQFYRFLDRNLEKVREKEFKENIDELQFLVKSYRDSREFKKLLDFVGRFPYLAPYNAMLVEMQRPGATFVLSGKEWLKLGRKPKLNCQKLIILKPFCPVQCVFDFEDTEPASADVHAIKEIELIEMFDKTLETKDGHVSTIVMQHLMDNLPTYGIYLDKSFVAANTYGGYIQPYKQKKLTIKIYKDTTIQYESCFALSVNHNQNETTMFHTICHELGHLFCYHLAYNDKKRRKLTLKEREFEAETVAWLVCKRQGIRSSSEEYLATYAPQGEIPICSIDHIMKAVTEIEKMLTEKVCIKDSLWYKEDNAFKKVVDGARAFIRNQKH